jgi:hypothetical protein
VDPVSTLALASLCSRGEHVQTARCCQQWPALAVSQDLQEQQHLTNSACAQTLQHMHVQLQQTLITATLIQNIMCGTLLSSTVKHAGRKGCPSYQELTVANPGGLSAPLHEHSISMRRA